MSAAEEDAGRPDLAYKCEDGHAMVYDRDNSDAWIKIRSRHARTIDA